MSENIAWLTDLEQGKAEAARVQKAIFLAVTKTPG